MITGEGGFFQSVIEIMFKWQSIKEQIQDAVPTRSYSEKYKGTNNPYNGPLCRFLYRILNCSHVLLQYLSVP